jgi:DNA-binding transcriptional MerR regulator
MRLQKVRLAHQHLISSTDIVKKFGVTYQLVNHYTNFGLLEVITKRGNSRMYDEIKVKQRLKTIFELVSKGYSLRLIRRKLIGV